VWVMGGARVGQLGEVGRGARHREQHARAVQMEGEGLSGDQAKRHAG